MGISTRIPADPLVDTETTELDGDAEIVELAILDQHGAVLLESLVKPAMPVPAAASAVHGLTDADLENAPAWPAVATAVGELVRGRVLVAHNAPFDERMLSQSGGRHALPAPAPRGWECTLALLSDVNGGRWPCTSQWRCPEPWPAETVGWPHRAAYDAACALNVLRALASASGSGPAGQI